VHSEIFDASAAAFAAGIDRDLDRGQYLRGSLFRDAISKWAPPGAQVLDYGCGPGRISRLIAERGYSVLGVDPSSGMIKEALGQKRAGLSLEFQLEEDPAAPLGASRFDAIVCSSVIEYVIDPRVLLSAFSLALRPNGILTLSYANAASIWRAYAKLRFGKSAPHYLTQRYVWRYRTVRALFREARFNVIEKPVYYDSPLDRWPVLRRFGNLAPIGTLGLLVARKSSSCSEGADARN
jgi:2-polyprenyl-3-methyl-5-hydroxy-6-metoxy-1,4-benzoquinol methylase